MPVFSDLDARALGTFEGTNDEESWKIIHTNDEAMGIYYKAPQANDGTPRSFITLTHACMHCYYVIASYSYIIKHHKPLHCNDATPYLFDVQFIHIISFHNRFSSSYTRTVTHLFFILFY